MPEWLERLDLFDKQLLLLFELLVFFVQMKVIYKPQQLVSVFVQYIYNGRSFVRISDEDLENMEG